MDVKTFPKHLPLKTDWRNEILKKSDITEYMIVETGFDDGRYLVMGNSIVDDELIGFSLDVFDENLVHKKEKLYSISKVYEPVKLSFPFIFLPTVSLLLILDYCNTIFSKMQILSEIP